MIPFNSFKKHNELYKKQILDSIENVFDSQWYVLGKEVENFEASYSKSTGVKNTIGLASGLDALIISLKALEIGPNDEVIVPSNTYIATWLAISAVGAKIIPVEPDPKTYNINPRSIEKAISEKTKVIMPVHLYGQPCDMDAIMNIAKKHNILFLLDACQSVGHIPVDVKKIQCDFLSTTSRKYLRGPRGMGFIYARKEILEKLKPSTLDMVTAHWKDADNYALDCNIKIFEQWEKSYALLLGFSKALSYLNNLGVENTWKRIQYLSTYLRSQLEQTGGIEVTDIGKEQCGIVTF